MTKNVSEILNDLSNITTKAEANRYLIGLLQENSSAWANIKYITGYLGNEERNRILNLFDAE